MGAIAPQRPSHEIASAY